MRKQSLVLNYYYYYKEYLQPWVPGTLSLGVKRPGHEADHSPPSSAQFKECMHGAIPPLPQYAFMAGSLVKHRETFLLQQVFRGVCGNKYEAVLVKLNLSALVLMHL
jgi:hypothetical protein